MLFADLKGSMELMADRDPEEAQELLDPVLERMMEAVHRYEGTVNQVMGDGIMALFGAPIAHEDHAVRACYAALAMQEAIRRYSEEVRRAHGIEYRSVWVSTLGKSWSGPLATTCTWITRPSARPPTWRRAWNSSPPGQHSADGRRPCGWRRDGCRSPPWVRCLSRGCPSPWRCVSWWGQCGPHTSAGRLRRGG